MTAFLTTAYELKAFADYDQAEPVSAASAEQALAEATRFIAAIAALL